ncbi:MULTISPECIES: hypothetical protein [Nocardia]|uniref:hypothetical protein n=1 Tax=Nocardia TaxID=1817 RepID=UPI000A3DD27F|nr:MULTISPECIES: hypothetical protein [Nocardia]MBF6276490.1 hypothetical protein [Nocardia nova]
MLSTFAFGAAVSRKSAESLLMNFFAAGPICRKIYWRVHRVDPAPIGHFPGVPDSRRETSQ